MSIVKKATYFLTYLLTYLLTNSMNGMNRSGFRRKTPHKHAEWWNYNAESITFKLFSRRISFNRSFDSPVGLHSRQIFFMMLPMFCGAALTSPFLYPAAPVWNNPHTTYVNVFRHFTSSNLTLYLYFTCLCLSTYVFMKLIILFEFLRIHFRLPLDCISPVETMLSCFISSYYHLSRRLTVTTKASSVARSLKLRNVHLG